MNTNIEPVRALSGETSIDLRELARDERRMLRVQFKEFVHFVEDCELEQSLRTIVSANNEDKWKSAA